MQQNVSQQIPQQYQPIRQPMNIQQSYQLMNAQYNNFQQPISSHSIRQVQPGQQPNQTSSISSNQSSSIPADLPVPLLPTATSSFSSTKVQQSVGPTQSVPTTGPAKPAAVNPTTNQQPAKALSNFDLLSDLTSMAIPEPIQSVPQPKLLTEADIIGQCYNNPNQTQKRNHFSLLQT